MSTKLYNGYKLPQMSAYEMQIFFEKLRSKLVVEREKLYKEALAAEYISAFDSIWLNKIDFEGYKRRFEKTIFSTGEYIKDKIALYSLACENIQEKYKEIYKSNRRNPTYDFQFSVAVIPRKDKVLCIIYTEQEVFHRVWENMRNVEHYGYWNNTDKPDGVTNKEWRLREKEWGKALKDWGIPALAGFEWSLNTNDSLDGFPMFGTEGFEWVLEMSKDSKDKRAKRYAKDILIQKKMEEYQKKNNIKKEDIKQISDSGYFDVIDYLRTDEGEKEIDEVAEKIKDVLIDFTEEHKSMTYSKIVSKRPENLVTFLESL
jgi:hypothetical protein